MKFAHSKKTLIAMVFAVFGSSGGTVLSQDDFKIGAPLPQQVRDDWEQRRQSCPTAHWKLEFREMLTPGTLNLPPDWSVEKFGLLPKENSWRERGFEVWLDFGAVKVRSENFGEIHFTHDDGRIELRPYYKASLYNGDSFQVYEPNEKNPTSHQDVELKERPLDRAGLMFEPYHQPFFWGRGMISGPGARMLSELFTRHPDFDEFRIRSYDPAKNLLTVRVPDVGNGYIDYEIDLGKQSAVTHRAFYTDNWLWSETSVEWEQEDDRWLPKRWSRSSYRGKEGELSISGECTVEIQECGVDLKDVVLHMTPQPGDKFYVEETDTAYVKGAEGEVDVPLELAQIQASAASRKRFWIISLLLFAATLIAGTWWMRRKGVI